jgi:zinc transporter 1
LQHASHNHRLNPPVISPAHNVGLAGVLLHLLGDAINSKFVSLSLIWINSFSVLDIGVIIAALIMMKATSPQRFYADPAVSLGISIIIAASAVPMSERIRYFPQ